MNPISGNIFCILVDEISHGQDNFDFISLIMAIINYTIFLNWDLCYEF